VELLSDVGVHSKRQVCMLPREDLKSGIKNVLNQKIWL
jgi:hypothetical protein